MSQPSRLDQMVAAAKRDIARQCAVARGELQPSATALPSVRPPTVAELVATAKHEIAVRCDQALASSVAPAPRAALVLPTFKVDPFSPAQGLLSLLCDLDWALVARRLFVLSVLGLFAFLVFPERTPEARNHLVSLLGVGLSLTFVSGLFAVMLWLLWRRD